MTGGPETRSGGPDAFPRSWTAEVLRAAPLIAPARQFTYPHLVPGEESALQRGALFLQVTPATGGSFLALCARGFSDASLPSGVWSCPDPDCLLAVAGGYAYWVSTKTPEHATLLEQRPVTALLASAQHGLLLLAGFHDVLALGAAGVCWRSGRLSWEGVTLQHIAEGRLHGMGWDMFADKEVPFTVDLRSGAHLGGGYDRSTA